MRPHLAGSLVRGRGQMWGDGPGGVAGCGVSGAGCRLAGPCQSCDLVRLRSLEPARGMEMFLSDRKESLQALEGVRLVWAKQGGGRRGV